MRKSCIFVYFFLIIDTVVNQEKLCFIKKAKQMELRIGVDPTLFLMSMPLILAVPEVGGNMPVRMEIVVVLPRRCGPGRR